MCAKNTSMEKGWKYTFLSEYHEDNFKAFSKRDFSVLVNVTRRDHRDHLRNKGVFVPTGRAIGTSQSLFSVVIEEISWSGGGGMNGTGDESDDEIEIVKVGKDLSERNKGGKMKTTGKNGNQPRLSKVCHGIEIGTVDRPSTTLSENMRISWKRVTNRTFSKMREGKDSLFFSSELRVNMNSTY